MCSFVHFNVRTLHDMLDREVQIVRGKDLLELLLGWKSCLVTETMSLC